MNDLAVFNFDNNSITATIYEGKPAFVAVEVAYALGYKDEHQAINKHCKSLIKLDSVETTELTLKIHRLSTFKIQLRDRFY